MAAKKKAAAKKAASVGLDFTSAELEMLRDVFGVVMPVMIPSESATEEQPGVVMAETTIAEFLAATTKRTKMEHVLWKKIAKACNTLGVVTGKDAPTFAVSAAHVPAMHVYKLEE